MALGIATAAAALVAGASWSVAALCASDIAALVFVIWVWANIASADARATARIARAEDALRTAAEAVLISAGAASLLAVAFTLAQAGHAHAPVRGLLTALSVGSVAVAWISVQTVYILRYARPYYSAPEGGIDFHDDAAPSYIDFGYLALTIGMTFQVSDTTLTDKRLRRGALHHALLSTYSERLSWRSRSIPSPPCSAPSPEVTTGRGRNLLGATSDVLHHRMRAANAAEPQALAADEWRRFQRRR